MGAEGGGRVALAGRKPRRISAAAGLRLASVFTESRGGGHLVAFTTVRGFLSPFFSLSFPDGGGDGWTLDAGGKAFKLGF